MRATVRVGDKSDHSAQVLSGGRHRRRIRRSGRLRLPKRFGALQLHAGVHALFLGETLKTINRGEDFETIGSVGFSLNW